MDCTIKSFEKLIQISRCNTSLTQGVRKPRSYSSWGFTSFLLTSRDLCNHLAYADGYSKADLLGVYTPIISTSNSMQVLGETFSLAECGLHTLFD